MSAAGLVLASFALAALSPLWAALLLPLLLGVPHAALGAAAVDQEASTDRSFLLRAGPALAAVSLLGFAAYASGASWPRLTHLAGAAAVAAACGPRGRAAALLLGCAGALKPSWFALAFAHGHNLLAVAAWCWLASRAGRGPRLAPALCTLGVAVIALGGLDGTVAASRGAGAGGLSWADLERVLAPGLAPTWAGRAVLSFVFLQAVHYASWVWLVPREEGGWSALASSARARWGVAPLWAAGLAAALLPLVAAWGPAEARAAYLSLVGFHGWLELAGAARLARA